MLVKAGGSFTAVTVIVKLCCALFTPSLATRVTGFGPTLAALGVPVNVAVRLPLSVSVSQLGSVLPVIATVSSASASSTVIEY